MSLGHDIFSVLFVFVFRFVVDGQWTIENGSMHGVDMFAMWQLIEMLSWSINTEKAEKKGNMP